MLTLCGNLRRLSVNNDCRCVCMWFCIRVGMYVRCVCVCFFADAVSFI